MVSTEITSGNQREFSESEGVTGLAICFKEICLFAANLARRVLWVKADFEVGEQIDCVFVVMMCRSQFSH